MGISPQMIFSNYLTTIPSLITLPILLVQIYSYDIWLNACLPCPKPGTAYKGREDPDPVCKETTASYGRQTKRRW